MNSFDRISFEWARMLALPEGWRPERFPSTVELYGPKGQRATIPVPYRVQSPEWWQAQAAEAIRKSTS